MMTFRHFVIYFALSCIDNPLIVSIILILLAMTSDRKDDNFSYLLMSIFININRFHDLAAIQTKHTTFETSYNTQYPTSCYAESSTYLNNTLQTCIKVKRIYCNHTLDTLFENVNKKQKYNILKRIRKSIEKHWNILFATEEHYQYSNIHALVRKFDVIINEKTKGRSFKYKIDVIY